MTTTTINQTLQYDEAAAFGATDTNDGLTPDNNVSSSSFYLDLTTAISGATAGGSALNYYSAPTSFPQYAQMTDFVSNPPSGLTSYFLASDSTGDAFSKTTGVATTLYVGTNEIFLYATDNANVLVGRVGSTTTADPNGAVALVIALGGTAADPELGVKVYAPITDPVTGAVDDADSLNLSNLIYLGANFNTVVPHNFDTFHDVPSGSDAFAMILSDTPGDTLQLLFTGFTGSTEKPITISQAATGGSVGGGGGGQHVGPGNSLRIDTITGGDFSKADTSSEDNNTANISFTGHDMVDEGSFKLVQINPGTSGTTTSLSIFAYDATTEHTGTQFVTDALNSNEGTAVVIHPSDVRIYDASGTLITPAAGQITQDGNGVKITGLGLNYTVDFKTPGTSFDRFVITNDQPTKGSGSNVTFDVGHIHVFSETNVPGSSTTEIGSHLVFEDGGPSFGTNGSIVPNVLVDETILGAAGKSAAIDFSALFDPHYGPDGAAASSPLAYALGLASTTGVDSGLQDTATGHEIYLFMDGANVVGRVGTGSAPSLGGTVDFTISVSADGKVTFQQDHAVVHPDASVIDEAVHMSGGSAAATAALVTLTATATDGDGDSASSQALGIGGAFTILDDEPHSLGAGTNVTVGNNTSAADPDGAGGPMIAGVSSGSFANPVNAGNDGFAAVGGFKIMSYTPASGGTPAAVGGPDGSGDYTWAYKVVSGVTDYSTIIESFKGISLFDLHLNSSGGVYDGTYTVTMDSALPSKSLDLGSTIIKAGGPTGSIDVLTTNDDGAYVNISGMTNTTFSSSAHTLTGTSGAVNASNGNVGVNNGNLDSGEVLGFQLFSSTGTPTPFFGLSMSTKTAQSSSYELYGLLNSDHTTVVDLGPAPTTGTFAKDGTITYSGNVLLDEIFVKDLSGNAIKVGLAGIHLLVPPGDAGFHFAAQVTDGDGDTVYSPFDVLVDGNNNGTIDSSLVYPS